MGCKSTYVNIQKLKIPTAGPHTDEFMARTRQVATVNGTVWSSARTSFNDLFQRYRELMSIHGIRGNMALVKCVDGHSSKYKDLERAPGIRKV